MTNTKNDSAPPKAAIYTRSGDQGKTRLVDGSCVEKFNPRVEAYGTVDELNSYLGLIRSHCAENEKWTALSSDLEEIQNLLFNIGSLLACSDEALLSKLPGLDQGHIESLEKKIDLYNQPLPELRQFILPGGHLLSSHVHVARTLCRRAERRAAEVLVNSASLETTFIYLNRLSDFLFTAARWINHSLNHAETPWKKVPCN